LATGGSWVAREKPALDTDTRPVPRMTYPYVPPRTGIGGTPPSCPLLVVCSKTGPSSTTSAAAVRQRIGARTAAEPAAPQLLAPHPPASVAAWNDTGVDKRKQTMMAYMMCAGAAPPSAHSRTAYSRGMRASARALASDIVLERARARAILLVVCGGVLLPSSTSHQGARALARAVLCVCSLWWVLVVR
jgi:hypothetical protein